MEIYIKYSELEITLNKLLKLKTKITWIEWFKKIWKKMIPYTDLIIDNSTSKGLESELKKIQSVLVKAITKANIDKNTLILSIAYTEECYDSPSISKSW